MRFIRGETLSMAIAHFHGQSPGRYDTLEFRKLLGRFLAVCQAVAYAHNRGVLHRDLKPNNVMLGKFGETLVVDWGLAKVIGRPRAGAAGPGEEEPLRPLAGAAQARVGVMGTPAFMSPEQAAGKIDELGPATDVYSLGATLYELLTNRAPFQGSLGKVLKQVERGEWVPPREVNKSVPAALDAICRKAMALRPADRYGSAQALAEDVEHWLADELVSAYAEPAGARLRRWMRKRPRRVTAALVLLLTAVVGLTVGTVLLERSKREVQKSLAMVEGQVNFFLTEVNEDLLMNEPGMQPLRQQILFRVLKDYEDFLKDRPGDRNARQQLAGAKRQLGGVVLASGPIGCQGVRRPGGGGLRGDAPGDADGSGVAFRTGARPLRARRLAGAIGRPRGGEQRGESSDRTSGGANRRGVGKRPIPAYAGPQLRPACGGRRATGPCRVSPRPQQAGPGDSGRGNSPHGIYRISCPEQKGCLVPRGFSGRGFSA
jgi:hypothetical protein